MYPPCSAPFLPCSSNSPRGDIMNHFIWQWNLWNLGHNDGRKAKGRAHSRHCPCLAMLSKLQKHCNIATEILVHSRRITSVGRSDLNTQQTGYFRPISLSCPFVSSAACFFYLVYLRARFALPIPVCLSPPLSLYSLSPNVKRTKNVGQGLRPGVDRGRTDGVVERLDGWTRDRTQRCFMGRRRPAETKGEAGSERAVQRTLL